MPRKHDHGCTAINVLLHRHGHVVFTLQHGYDVVVANNQLFYHYR